MQEKLENKLYQCDILSEKQFSLYVSNSNHYNPSFQFLQNFDTCMNWINHKTKKLTFEFKIGL